MMEAGIPIAVKNTNRPEDPGTVISDREDYVASEPIITGVTGKRNFVAVHVLKDHMSNEVGIIRRTLSISSAITCRSSTFPRVSIALPWWCRATM